MMTGSHSKAGLKKGDLIIEIQHEPVANIDELYQAILKIENEEDILIFIRRQDKTSKFIVLTLIPDLDSGIMPFLTISSPTATV